ncbi:MAG: tetratricopeptide repeat protein [Spirochaetales bacterium]|nr:tetratricopeptide repeat protein [Spirochaetales bacterium]
MDEYLQAREQTLIHDLELLKDDVLKIDRIITFLIEVRATLSDRVEFWIKNTLPQCREIGYDRGLFSLLVHFAYYYLMKSDFAMGKSYLEKASQIDWSCFLHSREHMYFYHAHGVFYYYTSDRDLAMEYFDKALELARSLKDRDFTCQMLNNLASYYTKGGEYKIAEAYLLEAFSLIDPEKNPFPALKIMDNLASLYIARENYDRARDYLDTAFSYGVDRKIDYMIPSLHYNYGLICEKEGKLDEAEEFYKKAYDGNGDKNFQEDIALGYPRFLFDRKRWEEGQVLTDEIIKLFQQKGMVRSLDKVYHLMDEYDI